MEILENGVKGLARFAATIAAVIAVIALGSSFLIWGVQSDDGENLNFSYVWNLLKDMAPYAGYLVCGIIGLWASYQLVTFINRRLGITQKLTKLTANVPVNFGNPVIIIVLIIGLIYAAGFVPEVIRFAIYAIVGGTLLCNAWIKLSDDIVAKMEEKEREQAEAATE